MKLLDDYNKALEKLLNSSGFKYGWTVYPIEDRREYWWKINSIEVVYYDSKDAYEKQDDTRTYSDEILHNRLYPKAVYETDGYTLIMVDTHVDGNKFLAIYDNSKKLG